MKAAYIEAFAPSGNVKVGQIPTPTPEPGEVLISVTYAGVNPIDAKIAEGLAQSRMPHYFPLILGWEASGIIHSLGEGVTSFKKGDKVYLYCRKPTAQWGSWAEYLTYPAEHVAPVPKNISMAEAAGVPLAGLTAWQALFDKAQLKAGERVLIHGGGGGVGGYAIQWAKIHGAHVITTASPAKFEYVKQFGADEVIDYRSRSFVEQISSKVDVAFDTIGGAVYTQSFEVLKPGGRLVSLLVQPNVELAQKYQVRAEYLFVSPNAPQLKEMARLFEQGKVKPPVVQEMSLDQAPRAIEEIKKGHTQGKIVLKIA